MTNPELDRLARFLRLWSGGEDLWRAFARLTGEIVGSEAPLGRFLANSSDEVYLIWHRSTALQALAANPVPGSDVKPLADEATLFLLDLVERLKTTPDLSAADKMALRLDFGGRIRALQEDPAELLERAHATQARALRRNAADVATDLNRSPSRGSAAVASAVQEAILRAGRASTSTPGQRALADYLVGVPPAHPGWQTIATTCALHLSALVKHFTTIRAAGGWDVFTDANARRLLGHVAAPIKGVMAEVGWRASQGYANAVSRMMSTGIRRGRRAVATGEAAYVPEVLAEPLWLNGREFGDGAIPLIRPLNVSSTPRVYEGFLHALWQVQSRENITLLKIAYQDFLRALRAGYTGGELRTADSRLIILLRPPVDGGQMTRFLIGEELGQSTHLAGKKLQPIPVPDRTILDASVPTNAENTEMVFTLLRYWHAVWSDAS